MYHTSCILLFKIPDLPLCMLAIQHLRGQGGAPSSQSGVAPGPIAAMPVNSQMEASHYMTKMCWLTAVLHQILD